MSDIKSLAELLERATPGPYEYSPMRGLIRALRGDLAIPIFEVLTPYGDPHISADTVRIGGKALWRRGSRAAAESASEKAARANGELAAEFLNALPTLLSTIATQAVEIERLRGLENFLVEKMLSIETTLQKTPERADFIDDLSQQHDQALIDIHEISQEALKVARDEWKPAETGDSQ